MNITADEKQMYRVMKALYESGIPICFKGSMVLKACLNEAGCVDEVRRTVDIDANWNSTEPPTAEQLVSSLQSALDRSGLLIDVMIFRMYGEGRSAGFMLTDRATGEELFPMDMDVNRPMPETRLYEIAGLNFRGVSPTQMIADMRLFLFVLFPVPHHSLRGCPRAAPLFFCSVRYREAAVRPPLWVSGSRRR